MPVNLETAVAMYLSAKEKLAPATRKDYKSTLKKWSTWGKGVDLDKLERSIIRDFLDWVHEQAISDDGTNPGRTSNKARENLRAIMSWCWEHDLLETLPRFPKPKEQRDVAGRHYLTKAELNALYYATYQLKCPRGWSEPFSIGHYWRCAIVLLFNYGLDTGTIWRTIPIHRPILWRHVSWQKESPNNHAKEQCRYGWLFYRRVKTQKVFQRPMNRVVHAHLRSILPKDPRPNSPVVTGGGSRPNQRFQELCDIARIRPKQDVETGEETPWQLKDLRKTCATYYDKHMPESSIEILGHSVGGLTYRHYAHRAPLAHKAITTLPQPPAFNGLAQGYEDECPCCRRGFTQA